MTKKELIKIANYLDKKGSYRVAEYYDNVLRLAQQNLGSIENAYAYGTEALSTTNAVSLSKYNTINATLGLPFSFPNSTSELNLMPEPSAPSQFQISMAEINTNFSTPSGVTGSNGLPDNNGINYDAPCFLLGYKYLPKYQYWLAQQQQTYAAYLTNNNNPGEKVSPGDAATMVENIMPWFQCMTTNYLPCTSSNCNNNTPPCALWNCASRPFATATCSSEIPGFCDLISGIQPLKGVLAGDHVFQCITGFVIPDPLSGVLGSLVTFDHDLPSGVIVTNPQILTAGESYTGGGLQMTLSAGANVPDLINPGDEFTITVTYPTQTNQDITNECCTDSPPATWDAFDSSKCDSSSISNSQFLTRLTRLYNELMTSTATTMDQWTAFGNVMYQISYISGILNAQDQMLKAISTAQGSGKLDNQNSFNVQNQGSQQGAGACQESLPYILKMYSNFLCLNYSTSNSGDTPAQRLANCGKPSSGVPGYVISAWEQVSSCSRDQSQCDVSQGPWSFDSNKPPQQNGFDFADFTMPTSLGNSKSSFNP